MIQKGRETPRRSSRVRSTRGQANKAWALYKSNPSRVSWVDLSSEPPLLGIHLLDGCCSREQISIGNYRALDLFAL